MYMEIQPLISSHNQSALFYSSCWGSVAADSTQLEPLFQDGPPWVVLLMANPLRKQRPGPLQLGQYKGNARCGPLPEGSEGAYVRQPLLPVLLPCLSHSEAREHSLNNVVCAHALLQVFPRKLTCSSAFPPKFNVTSLEVTTAD